MKKMMKLTAVSMIALGYLAACGGDDPRPVPFENDAAGGEDAGPDDDDETTTTSATTSGGGGSGAEAPVDPQCEDGVANGDETDIDCGGGCAPCSLGDSCAVQDDCSTGICNDDGICALFPRSCEEARNAGASDDGVYSIDTGVGQTSEVYCDMTTDGGGWTLISVVRNNDGSLGNVIVGDAICTSIDAAVGCKGRMPAEAASPDTEILVRDLASNDFIAYTGFSASEGSALRFFTLERELKADGACNYEPWHVGPTDHFCGNVSLDRDPELHVAASSLAIDLGHYPLVQWWRYAGWYVAAGDNAGRAEEQIVHATAYTGHNNKLFERPAPEADASLVATDHQALFYR